LSKELNCTIQGFDRFFDTHLDLKECSNQHEGAEASKKYQAIILGLYHNSSLYGCKHPCERNTYTANINTYHFNSIIWDGFPPSLADESYYHLFFYYKSDIVQKQVEVLVYDFGGFIAAAGGNLGLCLGFSCLSILFTITHWTKTVFGWIKTFRAIGI
jgi:hypothetical protein